MHGMPPVGDSPDVNRLSFIQEALNNAVLLLQTQFASADFRRQLRYTVDYNGVTTYHAVNFILKAMTVAHIYLNHGKAFVALGQAALMFEEAGAVEAAREVRQEQERVALLTQTTLSPLEYDSSAPSEPALEECATLFDIPSFLDAAVSLLLFQTPSPFRLK